MTKRLTKIGVNPDFQELSSFVHELPTVFETGGKVIYKGRNELKEFDVEADCKVLPITSSVESYYL